MQRSAWIFLAAIVLPSLGLAWLAVHSVRDQQVVLEHQQAIISQNITDALAKAIQGQMDQVRGDFVKATEQLLNDNASPQMLAQNFNRNLRNVWPMAEIGFAVNLDGEIYSPKPYEGVSAKTFRDENDRFLSNRENVEVYSSNGFANAAGGNSAFGMGGNNASVVTNGSAAINNSAMPNAPEANLPKPIDRLAYAALDQEENKSAPAQNAPAPQTQTKSATHAEKAKDEFRASGGSVAATSSVSPPQGHMVMDKLTSDFSGQAAPVDQDALVAAKKAAALPGAEAASDSTAAAPRDLSDTGRAVPAAPAQAEARAQQAATTPPAAATLLAVTSTTVTSAPAATTAAPAAAPVQEPTTMPVPTQLVTSAAPVSSASSSGVISNNVQQFLKVQRNVIPQQMVAKEAASLSTTVPEESDFRRVIGADTSGTLARFLENKLHLMVWSHATADAPIVFGAQLDQGKLVEALKAAFQIPELAPDSYSRSNGTSYCVAILDDTGQPVALSLPGFAGDWKHPFVATEIGEALPHWEAALYLVDPQQISRTARTLQATLGLIVLLLVAAIVSGGSLIAADVRRQVRLAQQKTDFVSNVSHELKTPLTSIRMFAELLAEKRVPDEERQATYLRIIAAEAARLTRLINNVLDFARLERGAPPGEHQPCDLVDAVRDVIETCGPHLETGGIAFRHEIEAETLPITGDRDALAQIILNLVSNAEKYGGNDVTVRVRRQETAAGALGCVDVLDRGPGIPPKDVKTIFEAFHRLDDSLASGIPGSGLGLTLARRMARAHGGDVTCSPRAGGGSCFTLSVPLIRDNK